MLKSVYEALVKKTKLEPAKVARACRGLGFLLSQKSYDEIQNMKLEEIGAFAFQEVNLGDDDPLTTTEVMEVYQEFYKLMKGEKLLQVCLALTQLGGISLQAYIEGVALPAIVEPNTAEPSPETPRPPTPSAPVVPDTPPSTPPTPPRRPGPPPR